MDKLHVFVHMLMRDASLKQRIPHTHLNFWELFQREKSKHYTRVNMICMYVCMYVCMYMYKTNSIQNAFTCH